MVNRKYVVLGVFLIILFSYSIGGAIIKNGKEKNENLGNEQIFSDNYKFFSRTNDGLIDKLIERLMKMAHMSALSAAIVIDDEVVWTKGFGLYDRENDKEASDETIYLVASISKTFTATAIMQLYEKGLLDIDEDVNKYLPFSLRNPNYPKEPITIRMLLAHQSSLAEDPPAFYSYIPGDLEVEGYPYPWLEQYLVPGEIHYKPQVWSDYKPGEKMYYANVGYSVLGYLVEIVSGKSFEEYCRENIFEPLGMKNSSFRLSILDARKVAVPYIYYRGEYWPLLHYGILDYPAGGLRTNVIDLSRFLIAHMNGGVYDGVRILNEDSVDEMHTVQYPSNTYNFQYGLGFQIWKIGGEKYIGHTGGLYGVATKMVYRQSDKTGIIFFTNKEVRNLREIIAFSLIERLLFWKASGFKAEELNQEKIRDTVLANAHLLREFDFDESRIDNEIKSLLSALLL